MIKYSSPGIYIESSPKSIESIKLVVSGLTGFIGITEKGPLHKGIKVKNFKEFKNIFGGFVSYGYLAYAVFGFFSAGGKECIVVRTAHINKNSDSDESNAVNKAFLSLRSTDDEENCLTIRANSEGTWGNLIKVKLWYNLLKSTVLVADAKEGQDWIEIQSTDDFKSNDYICLRTNGFYEYNKIRSITGNRILLHSKLKHSYQESAGKNFCEKLMISFTVIYGEVVEEYLYLSLNNTDADYYLDHINKSSQLITLEKHGEAVPVEFFYENLQHGRNGILGLTPGDFIGQYRGFDNNTGIGIFEGYDEVSLLAAPDLCLFQEVIYNTAEEDTTAKDCIYAVQKTMVDQCERLGNRFAILDAPEVKDSLELLKYCGKFDTASAAVYYPKVEILNPEDITGLSAVSVPASGHIAGEYIKCDLTEGLYRAPANKLLKGAVGLKRIVENDEYDILYRKGINCLKYIPGRGVKIWGARTLSSEPEWRYINVRRTFCSVRNALQKGVGWAVFEPNDRNLRKRLVRHVSAFLLDLWRLGYMKGTVPEEGFYIRCDDEINPPENIEAGIVTIEAGISIARPAEYLVIKITANTEDSVIAFEE